MCRVKLYSCSRCTCTYYWYWGDDSIDLAQRQREIKEKWKERRQRKDEARMKDIRFSHYTSVNTTFHLPALWLQLNNLTTEIKDLSCLHSKNSYHTAEKLSAALELSESVMTELLFLISSLGNKYVGNCVFSLTYFFHIMIFSPKSTNMMIH